VTERARHGIHDCDVLILGGGLTGLAAADALGERAVVLERGQTPGGLVQTAEIDGYWFDRVIHLLHFDDPATEARCRALLGDDLRPCPPEAWVECAAGRARFPIQLHLGDLDERARDACVADLRRIAAVPAAPATSFAEWLLGSFGPALCRLFFFPYNRKLWKRPLGRLAPSGLQWNIARPPLERVLAGARPGAATARAYNANGWYPRPPRGAPLRGMEVLAAALARRAADLRLEHEVVGIDLRRRMVTARHGARTVRFRWREACLGTLPLPLLVGLSLEAPSRLREACAGLARNRVQTVALCVRGPRPEGSGHWRYFTDERLVFHRLVFMHAFDPDSAPDDGWGLMAEISERAEVPEGSRAALVARTRADVERAGVLPDGCSVIGAHVMGSDPAYVVFTAQSRALVARARAFLERSGVTPLGRYGRWEYSSMAQVMRDGFAWGEEVGRRNRPADEAAQ
jgi:protoporphyrinogen oxidase